MNEETIKPSLEDVLTPLDAAVVGYFAKQVIRAAEQSANFAKTILQLMAIVIPGYTAAISLVYAKEAAPAGMIWAVPLWVLSLFFSVLAVVPLRWKITNSPSAIKKRIRQTASFRWWVGVIACVLLVMGATSIAISIFCRWFCPAVVATGLPS